MKRIKDYLYFYVPCKCLRTDTNREMLLVGIDNYGENWHPDDKCVKFEGVEWKWSAVETYVKPILRPLSDITDDELDLFEKIGSFSISGEFPLSYKRKIKIKHQAEQLKFLLNLGFDVFGLIEEKLAISAV